MKEALKQDFYCWAKLIMVPLGLKPQDTQWIESRRAFYAGAATMFRLITDIGDDVVDEDTAMCRMTCLNQELYDFMEALEKGEA